MQAEWSGVALVLSCTFFSGAHCVMCTCCHSLLRVQAMDSKPAATPSRGGGAAEADAMEDTAAVPATPPSQTQLLLKTRFMRVLGQLTKGGHITYLFNFPCSS